MVVVAVEVEVGEVVEVVLVVVAVVATAEEMWTAMAKMDGKPKGHPICILRGLTVVRPVVDREPWGCRWR